MEKLNDYYRSPNASARSETQAIACKNCSLSFAVVLVNRDDKRNARHVDSLRNLIETDCIGGLHRDEYKLNVDWASQKTQLESSKHIKTHPSQHTMMILGTDRNFLFIDSTIALL
jgi:hypothetical protein